MDVSLEIHDVKERAVGEIKPPSFPTPPAPSSSTASGFPAPRKRASAFKQQRQANSPANGTPNAASNVSPAAPSHSQPARTSRPAEDPEAAERRRISEENRARLESMSPEEIAEAQRELYSGLDPRLLEILLRRANIDEKQNNDPSPFDFPSAAEDATITQTPASPTDPPEIRVQAASEAARSDAGDKGETAAVAPNRQPDKAVAAKKKKKTVTFDEDTAAPAAPPPGSFPAVSGPPRKTKVMSARMAPYVEDEDEEADQVDADIDKNEAVAPTNTTHFPQAPKLPDLDPSDPDFLETLHRKFFPNLSADPSKLAWMAPLPTPNSTADRESPYYPGQESLPVSVLRFDFRGRLIPPRHSRDIPVTKGLHHHGEAPEAAGYTILELARLARSAVPAQRCLAFQTLGRMLFRLGTGEWGIGAGGRDGDEDDLAFAIWRVFKEGRVLESLGEAAAIEGGHMSSKAYATEALWLFEKGGWKEKWRGL
ncbi:RPAP1-like protein [Lasiosphaeria miniovina]|uniref:RPAP1-like protein n=1 Tax=Lasiosphaeria miniovina TaxID=1954250 RepID=A0AA40ABW3_9PEZI|nr:RPAP1-like protein [Lasiosphaeria miniovina]KAK0713052.1 RPAP1-like protein [Lasiosphaeria miniovina]